MRLYCLISFWLAVTRVVVRSFCITLNAYPRRTETTAAGDVLQVTFNLFAIAWLGSLLWGWL